MATSDVQYVSLIQALHEKYDDSFVDGDIQIFVSNKCPGKTDSGQLVLPSILALDDCSISSSGDLGEIALLCAHVSELDVAKNHLSDWDEIFKIIKQMPRLRFLNLTSNPLHTDQLSDLEIGEFPSMEQLILNKTKASWETIHKLLTAFPSLTELHLSLNDYATVGLSPDPPRPCLKKLHITGNLFSDWSEIFKLGQCFPNMEKLCCAETHFTNLCETDRFKEVFPALKMLNIGKTKISDEEELDKLRNFPKLTDVRLHGIPILQDLSKNDRRQMIIARLPNVTFLNGSPVSDGEREDAERAFIRRFMECETKPQRYFQLESLYGKLDPLAEVDFSSKQIFRLKVKFEDKEELVDVDIRQRVQDFKKLLQNFVGISPSKFILYYLDVDMAEAFGPEEMAFPDRCLFRYNIRNGDEFDIRLKETVKNSKTVPKFKSRALKSD